MDKYKSIIPLIAIFCILLVIGCTSQKASAHNGDNVSIKYTAKFENGTILDSSGNKTLTFVIGNKEVIKGVDYALINMEEGENKTVTIAPEDAYGLHRTDLTRIENVTTLKNAGYQTKIGTQVSIALNNNTITGVITDVNNTNAVIDFNPPLAGKTLIFDITLVKINKKTSGIFQ
jgi:FKBP-type peptidyl-prolyl cis-trans isomerase 2